MALQAISQIQALLHTVQANPDVVKHLCHPVSGSTVIMLLQGTFEVGTLPSWALKKRPAGVVGTGTGLLSALLHCSSQAHEWGSCAACPAQFVASLCLPANVHLPSFNLPLFS